MTCYDLIAPANPSSRLSLAKVDTTRPRAPQLPRVDLAGFGISFGQTKYIPSDG